MDGNGNAGHAKTIVTESVITVDGDGKMRAKFGMGRLGDGKGPRLILLDEDGSSIRVGLAVAPGGRSQIGVEAR